jgi:signal recognition particle receptor subunit beta
MQTTVGIDYGEITLDDGVKIGLYGTPGQSRFDFIWPVICQGALGVILLVDHNSKVPLEELEGYLTHLKTIPKILRLVLRMLMKIRNILLPFIGSG